MCVSADVGKSFKKTIQRAFYFSWSGCKICFIDNCDTGLPAASAGPQLFRSIPNSFLSFLKLHSSNACVLFNLVFIFIFFLFYLKKENLKTAAHPNP